MTVTFELGELGYAVDRYDPFGSLSAEVEVDHQVGAASEQGHVGSGRYLLQRVAQVARDVNTHAADYRTE